MFILTTPFLNAVSISPSVDHEPLCITRNMGLARDDPNFSLVSSWCVNSFLGKRVTLLGL